MQHDFKLLKEIKKEIASNSPLRLFNPEIGIPLNKINRYGCWCYLDFDHGRGHGPPVNKIDEICKALHHGYTCIMMDTEAGSQFNFEDALIKSNSFTPVELTGESESLANDIKKAAIQGMRSVSQEGFMDNSMPTATDAIAEEETTAAVDTTTEEATTGSLATTRLATTSSESSSTAHLRQETIDRLADQWIQDHLEDIRYPDLATETPETSPETQPETTTVKTRTTTENDEKVDKYGIPETGNPTDLYTQQGRSVRKPQQNQRPSSQEVEKMAVPKQQKKKPQRYSDKYKQKPEKPTAQDQQQLANSDNTNNPNLGFMENYPGDSIDFHKILAEYYENLDGYSYEDYIYDRDNIHHEIPQIDGMELDETLTLDSARKRKKRQVSANSSPEPVEYLDKNFNPHLYDKHDNSTCIPWATPYKSIIGISGRKKIIEVKNILAECYKHNQGKSRCVILSCTVEATFLITLLNSFTTGGLMYEPKYKHDSSYDFDYREECKGEIKRTDIGDGELPICCGDYPCRAPFFAGSTRGCCGNKTFDKSKLQCCFNNVLKKVSVDC